MVYLASFSFASSSSIRLLAASPYKKFGLGNLHFFPILQIFRGNKMPHSIIEQGAGLVVSLRSSILSNPQYGFLLYVQNA